MSTARDRSIELAAFASAQSDVWGVVTAGAATTVAIGRLAAGAPLSRIDATLSANGAGAPGELSVLGAGHELVLTEVADAGGGGPVLCHAAGRLTIDGETVALDCGAARWSLAADRTRDSVRLVAAWFAGADEDDAPVTVAHGVALAATRPEGAKGQERDELAVAVLGEPESVEVFDPRLSTTYSADGAPLRMGLELWLGESEEGEQYPRRVAGEAVGAHAALAADGLKVGVVPLLCHSRGSDGIGVYALVHPR